MYLSQVLGSQVGALNANLYLRFEIVERPLQGHCDGLVAGQAKGQARTQEPGVAASTAVFGTRIYEITRVPRGPVSTGWARRART